MKKLLNLFLYIGVGILGVIYLAIIIYLYYVKGIEPNNMSVIIIMGLMFYLIDQKDK